MTETVTLGDDLTVSAIGFGAMALTPVYGEVDDAESLATLNRALDLGVTFLDTADVYGGGANERLIAELLATRRDEVILATKFGIAGNPTDPDAGPPTFRGDAAYVRQSVDASLGRLRTDVVDLYYMHRRDLTVPIEETVGAMAELVTAGKVRHLGLSEVTADELRAAVAVHPIAAVQSEWSIWSRDVERQVVPAAAELGVGFVPYSPLGQGFLTGTVTSAADLGGSDFRHNLPVSPPTPSMPTSLWSRWSAPSPTNARPPRPRSPWRGCAIGPTSSAWRPSRSPAPAGRPAWRRTSTRSTSPSATVNSRGWTPRRPRCRAIDSPI